MPYEAVLAIMVLSIVGVGFYSLVEPIAEELDLIAYERTIRARVAQAARNQAARDRAQWLAHHWASRTAAGQWEIQGDVAHKIRGATVSNLDEVLALYEAITAPTLFVDAAEDSLAGWYDGKFTLAEFEERLKSVANLKRGRIQDAGHMLHHDQPEQLARMIEDFLA